MVAPSDLDHHPQSNFLMFRNNCPCIPLIKISAFCLADSTCSTSNTFPTCSLNQWYLVPICLVQGVILGHLAREMAPQLSSKTVEWVVKFKSSGRPKASTTSLIKSLSGRRSLNDYESTTYSACRVDKAYSDCSFDTHNNGQLAIVITYLVLDFTQIVSRGSLAPQKAAKFALQN